MQTQIDHSHMVDSTSGTSCCAVTVLIITAPLFQEPTGRSLSIRVKSGLWLVNSKTSILSWFVLFFSFRGGPAGMFQMIVLMHNLMAGHFPCSKLSSSLGDHCFLANVRSVFVFSLVSITFSPWNSPMDSTFAKWLSWTSIAFTETSEAYSC